MQAAAASRPRRGSSVTPPLLVAGKSVNNKDVLEDKKDDSDLWETQAAFLGPNLWDKTLPYDPDLKVQEVSTRNYITYCVLCASRLPAPLTPDPRAALGNRVAVSSSTTHPLLDMAPLSLSAFAFDQRFIFRIVLELFGWRPVPCQMCHCLANSVEAIE